MYPKLFSSDGTQLAILDNIIKDSANVKRVVNGEYTFSFDAVEKELKSEYFNPDNNLVVSGQTFDIKYTEQKHDIGVIYSIECEHVNYRLMDGEENVYPSYAFTGTPSQILTNILTGTEFNVGAVDYTGVITISVNEEITRKSLIYQLANLLGGEIEYTGLGFTINLLNSIGHNNGFEIRFGKNLKGITKTVDTRGGLKTYYKADIVELKNSNEYIAKGLQGLEVIEVGDTIKVIDEVMGIEVVNRILSINYNPIFAMNTSVEIANTIELITDKINQIETQSIQRDKLYNNVSISTDYGFRAERSDKKARATMGGGTISMDVGDGVGNYTQAMFFDALKEKFVFVGDIDASGKITGGQIIGGTINIGSGTFTVDSSGNVVANSMELNGGQINGGKITIGGSQAIIIESSGGSGLLKIGATSMQSIAGGFATWGGSGLGLNFATLTKNGVDIATVNDIPAGGDYATVSFAQQVAANAASTAISYTQDYAVKDYSDQNISLQYLSGNGTMEVRINGTYVGSMSVS